MLTPVPACPTARGPNGPAIARRRSTPTARARSARRRSRAATRRARATTSSTATAASNMNRASARCSATDPPPRRRPIPPEVEITSPEWFEQVDPAQASSTSTGEVYARGAAYTCQVLVAPGPLPEQRARRPTAATSRRSTPADGACDGTTAHGRASTASSAQVDVADLKAPFPARHRLHRPRARRRRPQTCNGRPNRDPYGFIVKVVVSTPAPRARRLTGEDQRTRLPAPRRGPCSPASRGDRRGGETVTARRRPATASRRPRSPTSTATTATS